MTEKKKVSLTTWVEFIHLAGRELIIIGHSGVCSCVLSCACDVNSASLVAFVAFTAVLQAAFCFSKIAKTLTLCCCCCYVRYHCKGLITDGCLILSTHAATEVMLGRTQVIMHISK